MAYLQYETITQTTWGRWRAAGLQYPSNQYGGFRIRLYTTYSAASSDSDGTGSYWQGIYFTSNSTSTTSDWSNNRFGESPRPALECGTTYYVKGFALWNGTWYPVTTSITSASTSSCGTLATPSLHTLNVGTDQIYVRCTTVANANRYTFALNTGHSSDGPDPWTTFTGLTPDYEYYVRFKARDWTRKYDDSNYSSWIYAKTNPLVVRPNNWSWYSYEISAFDGNGDFTTLTASRWNAFLTRVDEFCEYKGTTLLPSYVYVSSGSTLYASHMRVVANKIYAMGGGVSSTVRNVQSGDYAYGWYFKNLSAALNQIS